MKTVWVSAIMACVAFIAGWRMAVSPKVSPAETPKAAAPIKAQALPHFTTPALRANAIAEPPAAAIAPPPKPDDAAMALAAAIDSLTSPQSSFSQKQSVWEQLRKKGRLDEVIAALKQVATDNPNDATVAIALGEAEINQQRNVFESGGDFNQLALLALQADQNFNAALALDPTNWEAQFEKAAALSHWPASMNKGPEVIQQLSALVTQQESKAPQPEFAQTYLVLGEQYQAAGQADKAAAIWQQGLAQFPLNTTLRQELAHGATH